MENEEIRDKVRLELVDIFISIINAISEPDSAILGDYVDKVLNIPALAIVNREAELPPFNCGTEHPEQLNIEIKVKQDMIKDGWVKEIK